MKFMLLILTFFTTAIMAEEKIMFQSVQVIDTNNETLCGVKVELLGTGKTYYTNAHGYCLIPVEVLRSCRIISFESVSYQSKTVYSFDLDTKIVMNFR